MGVVWRVPEPIKYIVYTTINRLLHAAITNHQYGLGTRDRLLIRFAITYTTNHTKIQYVKCDDNCVTTTV